MNMKRKSNDLILDTIGEFGRWQKRTTILIFLSKTISCWCMAIILFNAPAQKSYLIHCYSEQNGTLDSRIDDGVFIENDTVQYYWQKILHPEVIAPFDKQFEIDFCDLTNDIDDHVERDSVLPLNKTMHCNSLKHEKFIHTKRTKFDWLCSRNIVAAFTQISFLFGVLTGGIIGWILVKYISPRNLILVGMIGQMCSGIALAFINDYKLQLFMRYLNSVSCAQMFTAGHIILFDIISPPYIQLILPLFDTFWSFGEIILSLIAYLVPTWREVYFAISFPTLGYIALWFFIPDSPRWHLRKGNLSHALKILTNGAEINKRLHIIQNDFIENLRIDQYTQKKSTIDVNWFNLWKNSNFLNILCVHLAWGGTLTNFNGMLLNTRNFGVDALHRNVFMTGIAELLGVGFAYIFVIGNNRKWLVAGLIDIFVSLNVLLAAITVSEQTVQNHPHIVMAFNLILKAAVSITLVTITSSTVELIEPKLRPILMMSCTIFGRMCLLSASSIGSLSLFGTITPLIVFSINIIIAGFSLCIINPNAIENRVELNDITEMEGLTKQYTIQIVTNNDRNTTTDNEERNK